MATNKYIYNSFIKINNPINSKNELFFSYNGIFSNCPQNILEEIIIKDYTKNAKPFTFDYVLDLLKVYNLYPVNITIVKWLSPDNKPKISFVIIFNDNNFIWHRQAINSSNSCKNIMYYKNVKMFILSDIIYNLKNHIKNDNETIIDTLIEESRKSQYSKLHRELEKTL